MASIAVYDPPFTSGIYNPPQYHVYDHQQLPLCVTYIPVNIPSELMKFVIGTNGYYFNAITHASRVAYIWYHTNINVIEIRGVYYCLNDAINRLNQRMQYIYELNNQLQHMDDNKEEDNSADIPQEPKPVVLGKDIKWADIEEDDEDF
jgi:hypothetical protein